MRPLCDFSAIHERQTAIEYLSSPRNDEIATTLHDCIKHIKNIPVSIPRNLSHLDLFACLD